jgi:hypothetical protein
MGQKHSTQSNSVELKMNGTDKPLHGTNLVHEDFLSDSDALSDTDSILEKLRAEWDEFDAAANEPVSLGKVLVSFMKFDE